MEGFVGRIPKSIGLVWRSHFAVDSKSLVLNFSYILSHRVRIKSISFRNPPSNPNRSIQMQPKITAKQTVYI